MPQGCWTHKEPEPALPAAQLLLHECSWGKSARRALLLPSSSAGLTKDNQTSAPSSNHTPTAPAPRYSLLSRCWVPPYPIPSSLWAPHGHTFIFNSVCLANLNNIIDFLFSWTDQSWDEHSCPAQLRGSICTPEIYIDSHLCFQLIPIDFALSVANEQFRYFCSMHPSWPFQQLFFKRMLIFKLLSSEEGSSATFIKNPHPIPNGKPAEQCNTNVSPLY